MIPETSDAGAAAGGGTAHLEAPAAERRNNDSVGCHCRGKRSPLQGSQHS